MSEVLRKDELGWGTRERDESSPYASGFVAAIVLDGYVQLVNEYQAKIPFAEFRANAEDESVGFVRADLLIDRNLNCFALRRSSGQDDVVPRRDRKSSTTPAGSDHDLLANREDRRGEGGAPVAVVLQPDLDPSLGLVGLAGRRQLRIRGVGDALKHRRSVVNHGIQALEFGARLLRRQRLHESEYASNRQGDDDRTDEDRPDVLRQQSAPT